MQIQIQRLVVQRTVRTALRRRGTSKVNTWKVTPRKHRTSSNVLDSVDEREIAMIAGVLFLSLASSLKKWKIKIGSGQNAAFMCLVPHIVYRSADCV